MRIDGLSGLPQPENNKGEKSKKVEQSSGDTFVKSDNSKIDFKTFISMASSVNEAESSRAQKTEQIKSLVQSGQYSINVQNIVDKMINTMGE